MKTPIIRVEDWSETSEPPLPVKYMSGDNELDFEAIYAKIKRLCDHPGRGCRELVARKGEEVQLKQCSAAFIDAFWDCAANLSDYFADFLVHDNALTQSIWFHLLDVLQDAAVLPHSYWDRDIPSCTHSAEFALQYEELLGLFNDIITIRKTPAAEPLVRPNTALTNYDFVLGGWKAGLKPWEQFLSNASPGFAVPVDKHVYDQDVKQGLDGEVYEQHIPSGGLGIIQRHTERMRALMAECAKTDPEARSEAELLSLFDQHSVKVGQSFGYLSLDGRQVLLQKMHVSPESFKAPKPPVGFEDPSWTQHDPNMRLLDECVGNCKGIEPFEHPDGEEDFYMWNVTSSCNASYPQQGFDVEEYLQMFDDWNSNEDFGI